MFFTEISFFSEVMLIVIFLLLWLEASPIQKATRMLSRVFFLLAVLNLWMVLLYYIYNRKMAFLLPWYVPIDQVLVMFLGPLLYFYLLLLTDPSRRITVRQIVKHSLPALPALAYAGYFISLPLSQRTGIMLDTSNSQRWMENLLDYLFYIQLMPYLAVCLLGIYMHRKSDYLLETNGCITDIRWLRYALGIALVGVLAHLPLCLAEDSNWMEIVIGTIVIGMLTMYIFLQSIFSTGLSMQATMKILHKPVRKAKLSERQVDDYMGKLHETVHSTRIYLNPDCTLEAVAVQTNIPQHHLSYVINVHSGKNFSDFINEYRCQHACKLLESAEADKKTIDAIGLDSGFRSKSVFYSAFKKCHDKTPFEYKASLKLK